MHSKKILLITITLITTLACSLLAGFTDQTIAEATSEDSVTDDSVKNNVPSPEEQIASEGLYFFSPIRSTETHLMNAEGVAFYTWESDYTPGNSVYLLENGNLLQPGTEKTGVFDAGGSGGVVQEIAPDNTIVWEFRYANNQVQLHHDIEQLPNGNILMIAWEYKTRAEAIAAGRDPSLLKDGELWPDHIIEVDPSTDQIVWEWHVWDHLIQDYDATKENYGTVSEHPELINLNHIAREPSADWNHTNAIDYNPELDQIMLSVHGFSEIWIIDHDTTTEEAAGPAGDLLYRWGNPEAYDSGTADDRQLYVQHDTQWIPTDYPGGGNILVFNNGHKAARAYSTIDEIIPPLNDDGSYNLTPGAAFGPEAPTWTYAADNPTDFFADHISGAQRLPNGNTLICSGTNGYFFEVTQEGEIVWSYDFGDNVFRMTKFAADYPGLANLTLEPGETLIAEPPEAEGTQRNNEQHQRALDACKSLVVGAACTIQHPNKEVSGSCQIRQSQLVCIPENRP